MVAEAEAAMERMAGLGKQRRGGEPYEWREGLRVAAAGEEALRDGKRCGRGEDGLGEGMGEKEDVRGGIGSIPSARGGDFRALKRMGKIECKGPGAGMGPSRSEDRRGSPPRGTAEGGPLNHLEE